MQFDKRVALPGSERTAAQDWQHVGPVPAQEQAEVTVILHRKGGPEASALALQQFASRTAFPEQMGADEKDQGVRSSGWLDGSRCQRGETAGRAARERTYACFRLRRADRDIPGREYGSDLSRPDRNPDCARGNCRKCDGRIGPGQPAHRKTPHPD